VLEAFAVLQAIKPAIGSISNKTASTDSDMDIDNPNLLEIKHVEIKHSQEFRCYLESKIS
jgi:hypothetical protein